MTSQISLPEILLIPPKLMPLITDFNHYKYFLIEGGRGSAKTQSVGRVLLYIAEQVKARIFCGRELQDSIEESVFSVLNDHITNHNLAFRVRLNGIRHLMTGSTFKFKGFREQGSVKIKGIEGVDIIWVDEAEAITKPVLDKIIPTVRKNNARLIFTMNRFLRSDAVIKELAGRPDCLHIRINYFENPYCPLTLKHEAELLKNKDRKSYNHIWLGQPLETFGDYLFNFEKIEKAKSIAPFGELFTRQRILAIDFAAQGADLSVATILDRVSPQHWKITEQIAWGEPDPMVTVGKIVQLIGEHKPTISILDVGGGGHVVWSRLNEVLAGTKKVVQRFDGGGTKSMNVDTKLYVNARAEGYYEFKEWVDQGYLIIDGKHDDLLVQMETIRTKPRSNGVRGIRSKDEMRNDKPPVPSPDHADSVMMGIWAAKKFLGKTANTEAAEANVVVRRNISKRKRG
jgi:hypothetical protein